MYALRVAEIPIPARMHMTGASTSIRRTITPCEKNKTIRRYHEANAINNQQTQFPASNNEKYLYDV